MDIHQLTLFLGWCTVINVSVLTVSTVLLSAFKTFVITIHSKLLGIECAALPPLYFRYLANYKVLVMVFNVGPYLALKLMG